ncbi:unnamed protein product [Rotaria sp. Silwood2]|nr:unnamed protein product [Rotaria sp. Silwood2]CAF4546237.1 unnamed protein product [Rotaria sp. Silwood2]
MRMNLLEFNIAHKFGEQKRRTRYYIPNTARRKKRLLAKISPHSHLPTATECAQSQSEENKNITIDDNDYSLYNDILSCNESYGCLAKYASQESNVVNNYETSTMLNDAYDERTHDEETQSDEDECVSPDKTPLHNYTINSTYSYCEAFTVIARQANISRKSTNDL